MAVRKDSDPSPFRAGLLHGVLSFAVFAAVAGVSGGLIHLTGDPEEAGPQQLVALFDTTDGERASLRGRTGGALPQQAFAQIDPAEAANPATEPNLGVADPVGTAPVPVRTDPEERRPRGVRINGKLVNPGQRYSEVNERETALTPTSQQASAPVAEQVLAEAAKPIVASAEATYARAFSNPEGKPVVSLIVGGLGTSQRQALAAIKDLPPEVTLAFVPGARADLLKYARNKGHEILLEVPMESLGRGRTRPHSLTLLAGADGEQNVQRLNGLLRGKRELYGVINYQGGKFAGAADALGPVFARLDQLGLAFFGHGATQIGPVEDKASEIGLTYAVADQNIDTEIRASEIEAQLFQLETEALENGYALGTGSSYPLTVDLVASWSQRLAEKGILLAPASAVAELEQREGQFQTSQLDVDPASADIASQ